ncbi:MAG TPA: type II 3-dehydroquinate dehydratase [Clostridiales bacterium]|nr:type II 3-dehydroquinate dehydratase [Clostridiales bacterium]
MKILIINGPNLNLLGLREPAVYGSRTYSDLCTFIGDVCVEHNIEYKLFQSNSESAIIDEIQAAYGVFDGIVINPAAYTHTSIAIPDAIKAVGVPAIEVHISNIYEREEYRHRSFTSQACITTIYGLGFDGYKNALILLKDYLTKGIKPEQGKAPDGRKIAGFLKVSRQNYQPAEHYGDIKLPLRATEGSAGYDFFAPYDIALEPHQTVTVPTGIRARIDKGWVLMIFPRSGLGFKYRLMLNNTVGIIDSDYFYSDNEGHIFIRFTNGDSPLCIRKGDAFAQGVFVPYGITSDDCTDAVRNGGFGSTDIKK